MHWYGFPMALETWVDSDDLAEWVQDATDHLIGTVADFDHDDGRWMGPYLPIVKTHPSGSWPTSPGSPSGSCSASCTAANRSWRTSTERYDSALVAHKTRWQIDYPDSARTLDYLRRVADDLIDVVGNDGGLDSTAYYVATPSCTTTPLRGAHLHPSDARLGATPRRLLRGAHHRGADLG